MVGCVDVVSSECEFGSYGYGLEVVDGEGVGVSGWECLVYGVAAEVADVLFAEYAGVEAAPGTAGAGLGCVGHGGRASGGWPVRRDGVPGCGSQVCGGHRYRRRSARHACQGWRSLSHLTNPRVSAVNPSSRNVVCRPREGRTGRIMAGTFAGLSVDFTYGPV